MEVKDLIKAKIDQDVIDFINNDGRSIRVMIESVSKGKSSSEITQKIRNIRRRIANAGYEFDDNSKKYVKVTSEKNEIAVEKSEHNSEKDSVAVVEIVKEVKENIVIEEKKEDNTSKKSLSKKELLEQLKAYQEKEEAEKNLLEKRSNLKVFDDDYLATLIHQSATRMKEDEASEKGLFNLCFFAYTDILDEFKKVEDRYYYLKSSFIVDAFIDYASVFLEKDNLKIMEYQAKLGELMHDEKVSKKKVTYKLSQQSVEGLGKLKKKFPFMSKQTDLMNLILLAYSTEFNKNIEEKTKL